MGKVRLIPYGISDFQQLRREGKYYADKTMFLQTMELTGNFLFLVRPRRFGKSIFLSMMRSYYDINEDERFDELFSGLYVHEHPTENRAKYQVLFLDFSQVGGDSHTARQLFEDYGCGQIDDFAKRYARFYDKDFVANVRACDTFAKKLNLIHNEAYNAGHQMYLVVDEYDNFTNNILNQEGEGVYHELTHASGFYRDVFKLFKPNFSRILMMGVTPVTLDDLTSGYNIATNVSLRPEFNTMLGFSEDDVRTMIQYYQGVGMLQADVEELIADMKPWYNNYCFSKEAFPTDPKVFNSDMVCYYLNYYMQVGHAPGEHIDPNTKTDYKKLKNIVRLGRTDQHRQDIIHTIAEDGRVLGTINSSFPAERMADDDNFLSLLYFYGMLTIVGIRGSRLWLGIPNNNVRLQYYAYMRQEYEKAAPVDIRALQDGFDAAAFDGDWKPLADTITDAYHANTSSRSLIEGERNLQGFMSAFLSLNPYYLTEPEVEMNHGYCDFFMLPDHLRFPEVAHSYILELKYLKMGATDAEAESQWQAAVAQIHEYAKDTVVNRLLGGTKLHLVVLQIKGSERIREEEV